MTRAYGWRDPDSLGRSHYAVSRVSEGAREALPVAVRNTNVPAEVYDQNSVGECVASALSLATRATMVRCGYVDEAPSRMDLYWRTRASEGTTERDAGAMIADGVEALRRGWMLESEWPREPVWGPRWTQQPPALAEDAPRIVNAEALPIDVTSLFWECASGHCPVIGLRIEKSWETLSGDTLPDPTGDSIGGHAVAVVGADNSRQCFRIRNSWGNWNGSPEVWLPFSWIRLGVCGEAYAIRAVRRAP